MRTSHTNDVLKESYDNLAFSCQRVMKDIEDLAGDELFILNRNGGFSPTLSTVSENEMEFIEYQFIDIRRDCDDQVDGTTGE